MRKAKKINNSENLWQWTGLQSQMKTIQLKRCQLGIYGENFKGSKLKLFWYEPLDIDYPDRS
jgi:putative ubiquitin-RnfH superfamily antitoxin RatB of RatAB toxin-antitoxin module